MSELDELREVANQRLEEEMWSFLDANFKAAWVMDLEVGDIFAGPRIFAFDPPRKLYVVERIHKQDDTHIDGEGEIYANYVVNMIVTDENELECHLAYGHTHEIYIWQGNK